MSNERTQLCLVDFVFEPEPDRRYSRVFAEDTVKIRRIAEAAAPGDGIHRERGVAQQQHGFFQTFFPQERAESQPEKIPDGFRGAGRRERECFRQIRKPDVAHAVRFQKCFDHLPARARDMRRFPDLQGKTGGDEHPIGKKRFLLFRF